VVPWSGLAGLLPRPRYPGCDPDDPLQIVWFRPNGDKVPGCCVMTRYWPGAPRTLPEQADAELSAPGFTAGSSEDRESGPGAPPQQRCSARELPARQRLTIRPAARPCCPVNCRLDDKSAFPGPSLEPAVARDVQARGRSGLFERRTGICRKCSFLLEVAVLSGGRSPRPTARARHAGQPGRRVPAAPKTTLKRQPPVIGEGRHRAAAPGS